MATDIRTWGISTANGPMDNTCAFLSNYKNVSSNTTLHLPAGTYKFNMIYMGESLNNITFHGDTDNNDEPTTIIKFEGLSGGKAKWCGSEDVDTEWNRRFAFLRVSSLDGFTIRDIEFTSVYDENDLNKLVYKDTGYIWLEKGSKNGTLQNLRVYDSGRAGIIVGTQQDIASSVENITVEDCLVKGQRVWEQGTKASLIAAGRSDNITFTNCIADANSQYGNYTSPANLIGNDNATNVEFWNCQAIGNDNTPGSTVGFWAEGPDNPTTELHNCTFTKTDGGVGALEHIGMVTKVYDCYFNDCSAHGWAAWTRNGLLEIYDSTFDKCSSSGPWRKGGVVAEGNIIVDNCEFINTPEFNEEGGTNLNISFYTPDEENDPYTMNIKNNTFDRGVTSFNDSSNDAEVTVHVYYNLFQGGATLNQNGPNYTWDVLKAARTTAINSPTSGTTVGVNYDSHTTNIQYWEGEPLDMMLHDMESSINGDSSAKITAEIDTDNNTITFKQKVGASGDWVNIQIDSNDWQNGNPFSDMNPSMEP